MAPMRVALPGKKTSHIFFDTKPAECYVSNMWTQSCSEAASLLMTYLIALGAYHHSQRASSEANMPSDPALSGVLTAREEALLNLFSAKEAYWGHVDGHGCRQQLIEIRHGGLS